eukprot:7128560-Karenia_brevis.AAC.1
MPLFCAMKKEMRDRTDFMADLADDGVIGGDYCTVLRVLKAEIELGNEYGVRHNFSKMLVYVLAGQRFQGDLQEFIDLGVQVDYTGN